jgi:hypothetical protein
MLSERQRQLFSAILDTNWDYEHEVDPAEKEQIGKLLREQKLELKLDMGEEAYDEFIRIGKEMFAPRK